MAVAKVILFVAVAVVSRAGSQDLQIKGFSVNNTANPVEESNPLLFAAFDARMDFITFLKTVPERYNWLYQITEPTQGEIRSQYESRDGDLVHGSYAALKTDYTGATLYYTIDDVNKKITGLRMERNLARLYVPVASPKNGTRVTELIEDDPLGVEAARANEHFSLYFRDAFPTRYSWSYEVHDPVTGGIMSQYQSLHDGTTTGSYTLAKPDGSSRRIYYTTDSVKKVAVDHAEKTDSTVPSSTVNTPAET